MNPLSEAELDDSKRHHRKQVARAFELFFAKNPELKELDRRHGTYQREFVRPWAKRRHPDGFKHTPTLTLPSAEKHPAWFSFKKNETYKSVDLSAGLVRLKVVQSAEPSQRSRGGFVSYRFKSDARMRRFTAAAEPTVAGREKCDLLYDGNDGLPPRAAAMKGIKLVFKNGQPYLYFTFYVADVPSRISLTQASLDKYPYGWTAGKLREQAWDPPLRTMAIDLGIRHIAAATIMEEGRLVAARFIHHDPVLITGRHIKGIATLEQIARMKRELRRRLRQRGKPARGTESCKQLRAHIRRMSEDRFKKCAVAIVDLARGHRVDLLVMEQLAGLVPDAERERGINRALVNWNRGQLSRWVKMLGEGYGLKVVEVAPHWTSQVCSRCNRLGTRYTLRGGTMSVQTVGPLFGCPACGYRCNADFNASINLHRVFLGGFPAVRRIREGFAEWEGVEVRLEDLRKEWEKTYLGLESPF